MQYAVVMNPDCEFYSEDTVFNEGTVIYGHPGSTAQTYAETYGFTFEDLANLPAEAVSGGMIYADRIFQQITAVNAKIGVHQLSAFQIGVDRTQGGFQFDVYNRLLLLPASRMIGVPCTVMISIP